MYTFIHDLTFSYLQFSQNTFRNKLIKRNLQWNSKKLSKEITRQTPFQWDFWNRHPYTACSLRNYHHILGWLYIRWCGCPPIIMLEGGIKLSAFGGPPMQGFPSLTRTGTATLLGEGKPVLDPWSWRPFSCWALLVLYLQQKMIFNNDVEIMIR